jgi:RNA polymerase sigma-70 factor (ECF subfamily)
MVLHAGDLFLACACLHQIPAAIDSLERSHLSELPNYLARANASPDEVNEIRQQMREVLYFAAEGRTPKLAEYAGRGTLRGWLRVMAVRRLANLRRGLRNRRTKSLDDSTLLAVAGGSGPEIDYLKRRSSLDVKAALHVAIAQLSAEQLALLRLHFVDGLTLSQIGTMYRVHSSTILRRIAAAQGELLRNVRQYLRTHLRLATEEMESLVRLVQSQLDLSLSRVLAPRSEE